MRLSRPPSLVRLCLCATALTVLLLAIQMLQFSRVPAKVASVHAHSIQRHWRKAGVSTPTDAEESLSSVTGVTSFSGSGGAQSVSVAVRTDGSSTGLTSSAIQVLEEQREGRTFGLTGSTVSAGGPIQMSEEQKEGSLLSAENSFQMSREQEERGTGEYAGFKVHDGVSKFPGSKEGLVYSQRGPGQHNGELSMKACDVPAGGFKAWRQGVVSTLMPEVPVDCSRVIAGDGHEVGQVREAVSRWKNAITDGEMLGRVRNCTWLTGYFTNNLFVSGLERSFPIAFTFVVHDSPQQVLRLLRLLYRPHNTYCIHYDLKSEFNDFFQSVARCFDNILISSQVENVVWGYYTIMQAQVNCLSDLLHYRASQQHKWKYVINLCGKELPLVTNKEMVSKLIRLEGSSSIITEPCANKKVLIQQRLTHPVRLNQEGTEIVMDKHSSLDDRPFDLSLYHKSSSYNALSFQFSHYLVFNSTAQRLYEFFKKTRNSEEHFYATLYHIPGVPGGYKGHLRRDYFDVAGSYWSKVNTFQKTKKHQCHGVVVHKVCVVGAGDLPGIVRDKSRRLFHNKYFMDYDHTVMGCMEERIVAGNRREYKLECEGGAVR